MPLTDIALKRATSGPKPYKLADARGLYIEVAPSGGKWWRLKYRIDGKEKRLSLGFYPSVGIKAARDAADDARKLLTQGIDPSSQRKAGKLHGKSHIVSLSTQAVQILDDLHPITGRSPYVFHGERHHNRPMSDATVNAALRAMGFSANEVTGHGFRATARTMMVERLSIPEHVIEAQLAHSVNDSLGREYNRTGFLDERKMMMQAWSDYLDQLIPSETK